MSEQEYTKARALSPKSATNYRKLLRLQRTITSSPRSWFHLGHAGVIHLVNQRVGNTSTGSVKLTRSEFEKFVAFYEKAQKCPKLKQ